MYRSETDPPRAATADPHGAGEVALLVMDGPALVFGGPYSNLEATLALRAEAQRLGIPPARTICTGDVVAYCADAEATVAAIRDWGCHVVMGNCEENLARRADDCGCGFEPGSACDRLSTAWFAHADRQLSAASRSWMGALPRRIDIAIGGRRLAVVHASADSINRFVFASTPWPEKAYQIRLTGCDGVIGGHSGLPFTELAGGLLWHNAGAIGMPADDGTPRVWYSLLLPEPSGFAVRTLSLDYDHRAAAAKLRDSGLPEGYAAALENGMWPSTDVLLPGELKLRGRALLPGAVAVPRRGKANAVWPGQEHRSGFAPGPAPMKKFADPAVTASGEKRAVVPFSRYETLWLNTGTLCNIACHACYIESTPKNDRLAHLTRAEARAFIDEAAALAQRPSEIGFTGGEPFMNPDVVGMIEDALVTGFRVLVLTNAMRPMQKLKPEILALHRRFPGRLTLRVSLDHYEPQRHEVIRGKRTWAPALAGLAWLAEHGLDFAVASRMLWGETEAQMRGGFARLFADQRIAIDAGDSTRLVLFPEMDEQADVPEITERCWGILAKSPADVMCATSRMVVKRKGAARPAVVACTLLPYDEAFETGATLAEAARPVALNHTHCSRFCVLGGASCSAKG